MARRVPGTVHLRAARHRRTAAVHERLSASQRQGRGGSDRRTGETGMGKEGEEVTEKVIIGNAELYLGDCLQILPTLGEVDAVVTDPPYGMDWKFTGQGSGKQAQGGKHSVTKGQRIKNDDVDFCPAHLMGFPRVVIWGMHHFPQHLNRGSVLVWVKKYPDAFGTFLSDADLAWMKGGCGVYVSQTINPASFQAEKAHPTQKPVSLMEWCIQLLRVADGATIADPYMGSGTTGVAAANMGMKFIGVEIDRKHFDIACERIAAAQAQGKLFEDVVG